ncbi:MAG TPA: SpoIIE family protein phosphatase, partial [Kofleriaceae bacterium]|nr:SpoIIE family protein phosphatase [Kofleriaceae bacterium]
RGPLERLIAQLVARSREITDPDAIAQLAIDVVDLGVGVRAHVLLVGGGGWVRLTAPETISASLFPDTSRPRHAATDEPLGDEHAPRAPLMSWLTGHHVPLFHDDLEVVPGALRDVAEQLFERQRARAVVPVRSADELLAIIVIPHGGPRLRGASLAFVERVAERLAEALLHARMASRAAARAALAREVQLAATVQGELLPGRAPHVHGAISVVGSWHPATRCAGDFWAVHALADARVLVTIGDVTGHGVASAMVTAAAVGACDVFVRRSPSLDLAALVHALDAAVRRVGGGELAMTCFAAVLDPAAHTISYVSCGHTTPYLCRVASAGKTELQALVGRGNLLGAGTYAAPKLLQRPLEAGDLVVWYTDGVIEAQDPAGKPFGDRRLQQLLRKLDVAHASSHAVHDLIEDAVAAHRQEHPLGDDATLVVAHVARTGA